MSRESDATILIVDNDPDLRRVISLRLSRAGYSCVEAGTGAQALSEWRRRSFDVVVSDLNMPSGDGIALADALQRDESCGAHFRVEHQYEDGEAKRNDDKFTFVSAWGYQGEGKAPELNAEPLVYENVHLAVRSYK